MSVRERPLSPHLSIYRPQISSILSITHRMTGVAMAFGTVLLVAWLWAAAYNAECYAGITSFLGSIIGRIMLVGWTFAFYFHLGNGIRHLFWDVGIGFSLPALHRSGWTVVIFSIIFTAVTWWCIMTRAAA